MIRQTKQQQQELEIKFIAKVGATGKYEDGKEKFHIMIPKRFLNEMKKLKGEQVKVIINDEF